MNISISLGILCGSLLGNILPGIGIDRGGEGIVRASYGKRLKNKTKRQY